jgi:hypothetical protein
LEGIVSKRKKISKNDQGGIFRKINSFHLNQNGDTRYKPFENQRKYTISREDWILI